VFWRVTCGAVHGMCPAFRPGTMITTSFALAPPYGQAAMIVED